VQTTPSLLLGFLKGIEDGIVLVKLAFFDGLIDTNNVLPNNAPSADVKVAKE